MGEGPVSQTASNIESHSGLYRRRTVDTIDDSELAPVRDISCCISSAVAGIILSLFGVGDITTGAVLPVCIAARTRSIPDVLAVILTDSDLLLLDELPCVP